MVWYTCWISNSCVHPMVHPYLLQLNRCQKKGSFLKGSLVCRVTWAIKLHLFSHVPGIRYLRTSFHFDPTHKKQSLWNEKLSKKCWSRQHLSCVWSFDLLVLLGGPKFSLYGKFPALLGKISVVNSEIPPRRAGPPLIYTKTNLDKEFNWDAP